MLTHNTATTTMFTPTVAQRSIAQHLFQRWSSLHARHPWLAAAEFLLAFMIGNTQAFRRKTALVIHTPHSVHLQQGYVCQSCLRIEMQRNTSAAARMQEFSSIWLLRHFEQ